MKTPAPMKMNLLGACLRWICCTASVRMVVAPALIALSPASSLAADNQKTFATPEEAVNSLAVAVSTTDSQALRGLLGPAHQEVENPDRVQATNEFRNFALALGQGWRLVQENPGRQILEVGTNQWPFPIPLVQRDGQWLFDTAAGKDEILNRRIGKNELAAIEVVRAYAAAQREYASRDRDGDEVLEYAQQLASTPGNKDGLYWSPELDGGMSPLGPLVAKARGEGYKLNTKTGAEDREPFHGYFFKILTRQSKSAPGGKYDYIINGNMIGGFALVAWPADYGNSGVMTFVVNQQGRVYQKDLGKDTARLASKMTVYDPDSTWQPCPD